MFDNVFKALPIQLDPKLGSLMMAVSKNKQMCGNLGQYHFYK